VRGSFSVSPKSETVNTITPRTAVPLRPVKIHCAGLADRSESAPQAPRSGVVAEALHVGAGKARDYRALC